VEDADELEPVGLGVVVGGLVVEAVDLVDPR
jgi:hypothetical protein